MVPPTTGAAVRDRFIRAAAHLNRIHVNGWADLLTTIRAHHLDGAINDLMNAPAHELSFHQGRARAFREILDDLTNANSNALKLEKR
jgi:hypothetical protein